MNLERRPVGVAEEEATGERALELDGHDVESVDATRFRLSTRPRRPDRGPEARPYFRPGTRGTTSQGRN
jgi:hypothetical protein